MKMRAMISVVLCLITSGCAAATPRPATSVEAPPSAPAAPLVLRESAPQEQERLRGLPWFGEVNLVHMESYGEELRRRGYWSEGALTTLARPQDAALEQRSPGYASITTMSGQVWLRLYAWERGEPIARLELPIEGTPHALNVALARGKIAALRWDTAAPELTMYRQADGARAWRVALDAAGRQPGAMTLAWHEAGELSVEWRGEGTYSRVIVDGETGEQLHREQQTLPAMELNSR
jgi:hypothetical protein